MYEIRVTEEFCGAHNLRHYKGQCEELHGHNWKVEISIYSKTLDKTGMVIDFKIVKDKLRKILQILDHKYLNDIPYFRKINPTSENIAEFVHNKLSALIKKKIKVTIWETSSSSASFEK